MKLCQQYVCHHPYLNRQHFSSVYYVIVIKRVINKILKVIEENIEEMQKLYNLPTESDTVMFYNVIRQIGYWQLGLNMQPTEAQLNKFFLFIPTVIRVNQTTQDSGRLRGSIITISCRLWNQQFDCQRVR